MTEAAAAGADPSPRELRRLTLAMLCAALAAFGMLYATQALLPAVGAAFGVRPTAASLTVSAGTGLLALAVVPLSSLAESVGRPRVMRWGLGAACALTLLSAAAPTFGLLLAARALLGVALAGVVAVALGHIGDELPPGRLGAVIGAYVAGNTLGGIAGRLVPGLLAEGLGWRAAVVGLGLVAGVAVAAFWWLLPPTRRFRPTPLALAAHLRALRGVLADRVVVALCLLAFTLMGGFVACYNYLTFRLEAPPLALGTAVTALMFLAYLAGTVSSPVAGRWSDRFGRRRVILGSVALALGGLALTVPDSLLAVVPGLVVFTGGFFGAHAVASAWVAERAPGGRGQAAALYLMSYYLGSSVLGTLVGPAYQAAGWPGCVAAVAGLFVLGGAVVAAVPD